MSIREFWRRSFLLPRLALVLAAVALIANLASYAGLSMRGHFAPLVGLHLGIMILGFAVFLRTGYHHSLALRSRSTGPITTPVPRKLVGAVAGSLVYLLVLFVVLAAVNGEGAPELRNGTEVWIVRDTVNRVLPSGSIDTYAARELRVFSAAWLFFGLAIAVAGHKVEARIHAYKASLRQAGA